MDKDDSRARICPVSWYTQFVLLLLISQMTEVQIWKFLYALNDNNKSNLKWKYRLQKRTSIMLQWFTISIYQRHNGHMKGKKAEINKNIKVRELVGVDWVTEWLRVWMNERLRDWVTEWLRVWMNEWLGDWVTEWLRDWTTEWLSDRVTEGLNDRVTEGLSDWVTEGLNEWVTGGLSDRVTEGLNDRVTEW